MEHLSEELLRPSENDPSKTNPVKSVCEKLESLENSLHENINYLSYFHIDENDESDWWVYFGVGGPA